MAKHIINPKNVALGVYDQLIKLKGIIYLVTVCSCVFGTVLSFILCRYDFILCRYDFLSDRTIPAFPDVLY